MSASITDSNHASSLISREIYQKTSSQLMTLYIIKLEEIVAELERCGGDLGMMKNDLRVSLKKLESSLPTPLRVKVAAKIKTSEKDHAKSLADLEDSKEELSRKRQEKRESTNAAIDFFKMFLPDMWVIFIQNKEKIEHLEKQKEEDKAKVLERKIIDKGDGNSDAASGSNKDVLARSANETRIDHEVQYQVAHSKLMGLYSARLESIRKAIELTGGDVTKLTPSIKSEITSLQTVLPEGHLKILNGFMEGKDKGKEVALELERIREKASKELASRTLGTVDLAIATVCEKTAVALGYRHEASLKHPLSPSLVDSHISVAKSKGKGFSIADMEAFNKKMSGEAN